ncbi:serine kinase/phosphatase [Pseudomonas veronii]|uniref:serine kinase/phosphatase n=1 Tax=Pseudomonas TaxID=286 RepID=UPI000F82FB4B|nr:MULTISPECIES: serine kinase/phosphatase [Pseudomonas]MDY7550993.1 serine kinase/phosphatase [Pseudomonas sp. FG1]MEB0050514.1 serine kinase/phosphatase [Pseudomonas sp. FG1]RTY61497.1 serine kinase/phosphatase [Pseudomonas veronii]
MTESRRPYGATQPEPIDDNEDRMGSVRELDFDDQEPKAGIGDELPLVERKRRMRDERVGEAETTDDEMSPENLIREDGARDAQEEGEGEQADWDLSIVNEDDIGGGNGLDEAELAEREPVNGNR